MWWPHSEEQGLRGNSGKSFPYEHCGQTEPVCLAIIPAVCNADGAVKNCSQYSALDLIFQYEFNKMFYQNTHTYQYIINSCIWLRNWGFPGRPVVKNPLLPMQVTRVQSLDWEDLLQKEMVAHSSILAPEIPWTEEPGSGIRESERTLQLKSNSNYKAKKLIVQDNVFRNLTLN